jgi:hypothetical protein
VWKEGKKEGKGFYSNWFDHINTPCEDKMINTPQKPIIGVVFFPVLIESRVEKKKIRRFLRDHDNLNSSSWPI